MSRGPYIHRPIGLYRATHYTVPNMLRPGFQDFTRAKLCKCYGPLSVCLCLSVTSRCSIESSGRIEVGF